MQLYVQTPYDKTGKIEKSAIQLVNFEKTELIEPQAETEVTVDIDMSLVSSYDYIDAKTYVMDAGDYYFALGNGAHEALNNVLTARGFTTADGMDKDGDADMVRIWNNPTYDATTYSISDETESPITNLFDDVDLNYWQKGSVVFLSRSDWQRTWPKSYTGISATAEMIERMNGDPNVNGYDYGNDEIKEYAEKLSSENIGSTETSIKIIELREKEYDDPLWESLLNQITVDELAPFLGKGNSYTQVIKSITYGGSNDGDGPAGYLANIDYNGVSLSTRIYEAQATAAASWNKELLRLRGELMGEDGLYVDKTSIWAPGANIHRTPFSGRNVEYYSEDGVLSYYLAAVQIQGMQSKGQIACVKHYAVNEQETNRGGISTFTNEQAMREIALRSFEGAVTEGGSMGIMGSFNRIGVDFAGQHPGLMHELLRGEWGYKGYVITDEAGYNYMQHTNAVILAGTDLYDSTAPRISNKIKGYLESSIAAGDYTYYAACRQAAHRILYAYVNSNAMNGVSVNSELSVNLAWWQVACICIDAVLIAFTLGMVTVYAVNCVRENRKENKK